jgi:hypothetical protein
MEDRFKSLYIISTAERDPKTHLFHARITFEAEHVETENKSSIRTALEPAVGRFETSQEAEAFGIQWARRWIDKTTP